MQEIFLSDFTCMCLKCIVTHLRAPAWLTEELMIDKQQRIKIDHSNWIPFCVLLMCDDTFIPYLFRSL